MPAFCGPFRGRSRRASASWLPTRQRATACLLLLVLGCGGPRTYSGEGDVIALDDPPRHVVIDHDEIPGLMPAMRMDFPLRSAAVVAGVTPGTRVRFVLAREGTDLTVTQIVPIGLGSGGSPGRHDHTPHHGGVVAMVGLQHVEAVAAPDGRVRVFLSDVWRQPQPVDGVTAKVTLDLPDGPRTLALRPGGEALEASGPALRGADVRAHVRIDRDGPPVEAHFLLPLRPERTGAILLQMGPCAPLAPALGVQVRRRPRCALAFPQPIMAVVAPSDRPVALVSVEGSWVTAWRVPEGEPDGGLAPAPPKEARADHPVRAEDASLLAIAPDGRQAAVAIGQRLLRYAVESGRLLRQLTELDAKVRDLAWSGDGSRLLVALSGEPQARVLAADDGRELARIAVTQEATAVAASADGRWLAVGSAAGPITVVEAGRDAAPRLLNGSTSATTGLAFSGDRLLSTAADGILRVWEPAQGVQVGAVEVGGTLGRLAVAPGGRLVASAGGDGVIRVHDAASGAVVEALAWHGGEVAGFAWVGKVLVSGDSEGRMALWDLADLP